MKKVLPLAICFLLFSLNFYAEDIPFDQYRNVLLQDYENYADNQTVTVTLTISNAAPNEGVSPGWGVGTIKPINNTSAAAAYEFNCKAISAGCRESRRPGKIVACNQHQLECLSEIYRYTSGR